MGIATEYTAIPLRTVDDLMVWVSVISDSETLS